MIKGISKLAVAVMAIIAFAVIPAHAQVTVKHTFANTGTAIAATNSHFIVTANGVGPGVATYVSATSDKAGSILQFWKVSTASPVTIATNASQAILYVDSGTSFTAGSTVVLRHATADTYERLVVSSSTSTNITFTTSLVSAAAVGDTAYLMATAGTIPVGAATKEITAVGGFYHIPAGLPMLVELDGTSACKINLISGYFRPISSTQ